MAYNKKKFISGLVDAVNKKHAAKQKFKAEVTKAVLNAHLRDESRKNARKESSDAATEKDKVANPQRYTPEQQYLRRRFLEQNPLAQVDVPTEQDDMSQGIMMPQNEVTQNPKTKMLSSTQSTSVDGLETQNKNLKNKIAQMQAQGQQPNALVLKIVSLQDKELARRKKIGEGKVQSKILTVKQLQDEYKRLDLMDTKPGTPEHEQRVTQMDSIDKQLRNLFNPSAQGQESPDGGADNGAPAEDATVSDAVPDWLPADKVENYKSAKEAGYSDEEIQQYLGE